ncbi:hypothetical protein JCGZ_07795 [Jatropha curcas]|uniref:DUF632 domain-containing protein n=1 Tax=Jatropha curcas TaxID=180498 RepID=A0A067KR10_JATCU|nr:protein ALTERED PHOSPHATE STARVATION RESPONSE 1 [Jatropha curcas]KDP34224.1 hypothetical protein JCGZ_07795 [Jatropha curcas]
MGCAQSKVDNEESVARCKERKMLMKEAVVARNALAAGHSGFTISLKNTGAALSDYAHGEVPEPHFQQPPLEPISQPPPPPPPPPPSMENLQPPPPLPFSPSPIKRSMTMPEIPMKEHRKPGNEIDSIAIAEEDEEEEEHELNHRPRSGNANNNKNTKNKDLSVSRGPPNGKVGPEETQLSPSRTPENHSVPPMPEAKNMAWDYFFMIDHMQGPSLEPEEVATNATDTGFDNVENLGVRFSETENSGGGEIDGVEPKTPEKATEHLSEPTAVEEEGEKETTKERQIEHAKTVPPDFRMMGKKVAPVPSVNLMQVLGEIDDHFLKASESAQEVSKMLEATRLHYHSNFADNRGYVDHSARVMRVITWNRSFKGVPNGEGGKDELDSEDYETHATVLDKLLAWEKKLYDEVKQGELMKLEYRKKVSLLNKQKKRGASAESLEKTKAAVSHLHTRYIVDMQSMDSTVSEVNDIRDKQLYPKLVDLVEGMAKMWASMCAHHDSQLKIVTDLKSLDVSHSAKETTRQHHDRTKQLHNVVQEWHSHFEKLVTYQKQYIQILNSWLKLNLIPIESSLKEKISSPPKVPNPPIQPLLHTWHDYLEKLPDEVAKSAISSFAAVIKTIELHQEEEMKLKEKCEETRKEFLRRSQAFDEWYQKHMQRRTPTDEIDAERGEDANAKDPVYERQSAVESLKKRLEEEIEAHQRHCVQVREKSLGSLKIRLPELFRAMSDYAHACSDAYEKLRALTQLQNSTRCPP